MKPHSYKIQSGQKCNYEGCVELATALYRGRYVCSPCYNILKKQARLKFKLKKEKEVLQC